MNGDTPVGRFRADWRLLWATVRVFLLRWASNPIMLVRAPLMPLLLLVSFTVAYQVSGQEAVQRQDVVGFLVVGILATLAWNSTVWGSGHALQWEIHAGTIASVIAAPTRTMPVVLGYGIGNITWDITGFASCIGAGALLGARFEVADPIGALVSLVAVYASSLCIGLGFAGLFILSRQANAMSNFLQAPIWLLAGFFVPRTALPDWLEPVSAAIPLAHAVDALRATTLAGRSLAEVGGALLAAAATSAVFLLAGGWSLRRVDHAMRRRGNLDLL
ncbi:ABC transporter permease [Actinopolymorpha sp. B11F2]|uniref:ABC transporter permease n=1 Tax=Actinopolymorpha sp. B11F2 TaxID=3160862 RepID=UPI0032E50A6C